VHSASQGAHGKDHHDDEWAILNPPDLAWAAKEQQRSQDD